MPKLPKKAAALKSKRDNSLGAHLQLEHLFQEKHDTIHLWAE
jgi:hypothetical protein